MQRAAVLHNIMTLRSSKPSAALIEQLGQRQSIIHSGDLYNSKKQVVEMTSKAAFDNSKSIPPQLWYDSLRQSDDGFFSRHNIASES